MSLGVMVRSGVLLALLGSLVVVPVVPAAAGSPAICGPGDVPETGLQGQVPRAVQLAGFEGFRCGLELVGQNTIRDRGGNHQLAAMGDCAYYTTTALVGANPAYPDTGMAVLDVSDPADPELVDVLRSPGTLDTLEALHAYNGIITASTDNLMDVYEAKDDCRKPVLRSTFRLPVVSHGFRLSDDGRTAYALGHGTANAGEVARYLSVIDLSDPAEPELILEYADHGGHDMDLSPDGNRAYIAGEGGLIILDTSDIQARRDDPEIRVVHHLTWPAGSSITSHTAKWVQRDGRTYILASNEAFKTTCDFRPQAKHIDITDETRPVIVADYGLEVNDPELCNEHMLNQDGLSYNVHYVGVDDKYDTELVFWNWFASGVRVFDFRDPTEPREIAYYNPPVKLDTAQKGGLFGEELLFVDVTTPNMWFQRETGHLWFGSASNGFQVLAFTDAARAANDLRPATGAGAPPEPTPGQDDSPPLAAPSDGGALPATGPAVPVGVAAFLLLGSLALLRRRAP